MQLTEFKRNHDTNIYHIKFDDGFDADISAEAIRKNCPCAGCKGEEVLLHKYVPLNNQPLVDESFILEKAEIIGNYAIQFFWKDGHNTGLYNWEYLKEICSKNE